MSAQVIGYIGENGTRDVRIPIGDLLEKWPDLHPSLVMRPVGGTNDEAYPVDYELDGSDLVWHVSNADTVVAGTTQAAIRLAASDGRVALDEPFEVIVSPNLSPNGNPPDAIKPWVDTLAALVPQVEAAIPAANAAAERAENAAQNWESGTAANADNLGGKPPEYYLPSVNLLTNSYWGGKIVGGVKQGMVNQKGLLTYTGTTETIYDRWQPNNANIKVELLDGYNLISNVDASSDRTIYHVIDGDYSGDTFTLAVCTADGEIMCGTGVMPGATSGSTTATVLNISGVCSFRLQYIRGYSGVSVLVKPNKRIGIKWMWLLPGTYTAKTLPPFVPRPYAVELAECMRYVVGATNVRGVGLVLNNGTFSIEIPIPAKMVATPSLMQNPAGNLQVYTTNGWETITDLSLFNVQMNNTHVLIQVTGSNLGLTGSLNKNELYRVQYLPFLIADL